MFLFLLPVFQKISNSNLEKLRKAYSKVFSKEKKIRKTGCKIFIQGKKRNIKGLKETWGWEKKFSLTIITGYVALS
jgi:hypothetical protein